MTDGYVGLSLEPGNDSDGDGYIDGDVPAEFEAGYSNPALAVAEALALREDNDD